MGQGKYEQLDQAERIEIYRLRADGKSLRFIAAALRRSASTISRELQRNSKTSRKWAGGYDPQRAQELTARRHARGRVHKMERSPGLRQEVLKRLAEGWSPEQNAGRMAQEQAGERISYESIYRYIYWRSWSFKETLHRFLATPEAPTREALEEWAMVENGHIRKGFNSRSSGGGGRTHTRRALLVRQEVKTSQAVVDQLSTLMGRLPTQAFRSMTFDNGQEFSKHYLLRRRFGIQTWFCDTHSPWQKGGIENAIGRLRRRLPRKTDLDALPQADLASILDRYNDTPRKCLGFKTPLEVFSEQSVALQT